MTEPLKWGILGTGRIAYRFAKGLKTAFRSRLTAVGSRSREAAERFGGELEITRCHGSYEALLADEQVQAVYIATPHRQHAEWAVKAAEAGKHILCEKPLSVNAREAETMIAAARKHGVFLMEAFYFRCHPQTTKVAELLRDGAVGEVRLITSSFCVDMPFAPADRLFHHDLAGGAILDVGCYCVASARVFAGAANGHAFVDPVALSGHAWINPETRTDQLAAATLQFPCGTLAQLCCAQNLSRDNSLAIHGTEGTLTIPFPWIQARLGGTAEFWLKSKGESEPRRFAIEEPQNVFALEADHVSIFLERKESPAMSLDDSLGNMRALDTWRECAGLKYDFETQPVPAA